MRERFPSLDADEVIQETLIELIRVFPIYHYSPKEKGHFHNYLTGILRHRALRMMGEEKRRAEIVEEMRRSLGDAPYPDGDFGRAAAPRPPFGPEDDDERSYRESLLEIALQQLLSDSTIQERTRLVFAHVAVNGEKPEDVAAAFGITRNAVDQIKSRLMARLKELVVALEKADGIED